MYVPSHFAETRHEALQMLIRDYPLAMLVTVGASGPDSNPVPLQLVAQSDGGTVLRGHVARANPLWREHDPDVHVLAVFNGPQAYITPSWYATKHEHGKVVPTWNYMTVQVRGRLRVIDDPLWLRALLDSLTTQQESTFEAPWRVDDAPADFIERLLRAIVGIEIEVDHIIGKWKLSQNQPESNRQGVISGLENQADDLGLDMARAVEAGG